MLYRTDPGRNCGGSGPEVNVDSGWRTVVIAARVTGRFASTTLHRPSRSSWVKPVTTGEAGMVLFGKELGADIGELTQVRNGVAVDSLMVDVGVSVVPRDEEVIVKFAEAVGAEL